MESSLVLQNFGGHCGICGLFGAEEVCDIGHLSFPRQDKGVDNQYTHHSDHDLIQTTHQGSCMLLTSCN